jgi:hypothetical protein
MQRKTFYSRIFKKKINPDNVEYWNFLLAEVLYRLKSLEELNCTCTSCFSDKLKLKHLIDQLIEEGKTDKFKRPTNFTGEGNCGRRIKSILPHA